MFNLPSLLRSRQTVTDQFFVPPATSGGNNDYSTNQAFTLGSTLGIQWASDWVAYEFQIWQQDLPGNGAMQGPVIYSTSNDTNSETAVQVYDWVVQTYSFDLSVSNVFFLWSYLTNGTAIWTSHYFNITTDNVATTTTGPTNIAGATTTIVQTQTNAIPTTATAGPTAVTSAPSQAGATLGTTILPTIGPSPGSQGLSTGAEAGIGVGAGLGGLLLIGAAIFFGYRLAKKRKSKTPPASTAGDWQQQGYTGAAGYAPPGHVKPDGGEGAYAYDHYAQGTQQEKTDAYTSGVAPKNEASPVAEMPGTAPQAQELPTQNSVHEMP